MCIRDSYGQGIKIPHGFAQPGQVSFFQSLLKIIHRAAGDTAIWIDLAILDPDHALGKLCRHTQESRKHQPECRTGSGQRNNDGHAANIADSNRAGDRGGQCLEMTKLTL